MRTRRGVARMPPPGVASASSRAPVAQALDTGPIWRHVRAHQIILRTCQCLVGAHPPSRHTLQRAHVPIQRRSRGDEVRGYRSTHEDGGWPPRAPPPMRESPMNRALLATFVPSLPQRPGDAAQERPADQDQRPLPGQGPMCSRRAGAPPPTDAKQAAAVSACSSRRAQAAHRWRRRERDHSHRVPCHPRWHGRQRVGSWSRPAPVLNQAFSGSGFSFSLSGHQSREQPRWFTGCYASQKFKQELAVDPTNTLNFYTFTPKGQTSSAMPTCLSYDEANYHHA